MSTMVQGARGAVCAAIILGLVGIAWGDSWPSKGDFDSWANSRVKKYSANKQLVGTCGAMTEIGSPRSGTIWIFGNWFCEPSYLEVVAEGVGLSFRQTFPNAGHMSVHVWRGEEKLATKRW